MIKRDEIADLPLSEIGVGQQKHFNHRLCSAGNDTRSRLYVLHKEYGFYIAYCHNCGESGYLTRWSDTPDAQDVADRLRSALDDGLTPTAATVVVVDNFAMPADATSNVSEWPFWVRDRLHHHHLQPTIASHYYQWQYSPSTDQLLSPIHNSVGDLAGYQARRAPHSVPKCLTFYRRGYVGEAMWLQGNSMSDTLVIVEDPLSAIRLHHECNVSVIALLGTNLKDSELSELLIYEHEHSNITNIAVWLDNDEAGRSASINIVHRLDNLYVKTRVQIRNMSGAPEPKNEASLKGLITWT